MRNNEGDLISGGREVRSVRRTDEAAGLGSGGEENRDGEVTRGAEEGGGGSSKEKCRDFSTHSLNSRSGSTTGGARGS